MTSPADRNYETSQPSWFDRIFRDSEGNIVIGQKPNLPAIVAVTATLLQAILPTSSLQTVMTLIAFGTWYTWAWQELFAGVNYFRRSLGLLTLIGLIALTLNLITKY
ncbi:hypothetical protein C7293_25580 [filamentous cyanobacterium CCT1]|nr:hypothetical protein C7293_25580 [filamentous cyanobacterium CCT1]PSN78001.1 hypothetical protein C8B47_19120 [filamentous cyanobacterium CCP4]